MDYDELYRRILDDELGWEHLITSIIREEGMDPMDIDLIKITDKFTTLVSKINVVDFRFGGKFIYTAAILLKMKSDRVVEEMLYRDRQKEGSRKSTYVKSTPFDIVVSSKFPFIRKRKMTISELISTIRDAMRASIKSTINFELKLKEVRIEDRIVFLLERLSKLFSSNDSVPFSQLITKKGRKEFVYTFLPLLFLANMDKIDLEQQNPFEEIYVKNRRIR